jgi:hypothetical protein
MGAGRWSAGRASTSRCSRKLRVSDPGRRQKSLPLLALCCVDSVGCRGSRKIFREMLNGGLSVGEEQARGELGNQQPDRQPRLCRDSRRWPGGSCQLVELRREVRGMSGAAGVVPSRRIGVRVGFRVDVGETTGRLPAGGAADGISGDCSTQRSTNRGG